MPVTGQAVPGVQLARGKPRPSPHPERGGKPRIRVHLAQLLADPHRQVPFGDDERVIRAVSSGTSGQGRGCIDMTTPFCGRAREEDDRTKIIDQRHRAILEAPQRVANKPAGSHRCCSSRSPSQMGCGPRHLCCRLCLLG